MVGYMYLPSYYVLYSLLVCMKLGLENKANALVYTGICISSAIVCITSSLTFTWVMTYEKTSLDLYVFIMRVCSITFEWLF